MHEQKKKVIFPTDFSEHAERALESAKTIAKAYQAELILLHIIEPPAKVVKMLSSFEDEVAISKARTLLDRYIDEHFEENDGVEVSRMIKIGKPFRKISEAAAEIDPVVVVMGTHGASGLEEYFMGSNASRVILTCDSPVVTLRNRPVETSFKKIILPLDTDEETAEKIEKTASFAKQVGASVHVISILHSNGKEEREQHERLLEETVNYMKEEGVEASGEVQMLKGDAAKTTIEYAKEIDADLITIMPRRDKSLGDVILRSSATYIVNHSPIPVLSIREQIQFVAKSSGSVFG